MTKEPNIIRGGTPYLSYCDATYVAPPAGGNAVDVLSTVKGSLDQLWRRGRVVEIIVRFSFPEG